MKPKHWKIKSWALALDDGTFATNGLHDNSPPRLFRTRSEAAEYRKTYWDAKHAKIVRVVTVKVT